VEEVGNAAKAFRLALRAINATGAVKPLQGLVLLGIDVGLELEPEAAVRRLRYDQRRGRLLVAPGGKCGALETHRAKLQALAVKLEPPVVPSGGRIRTPLEPRSDPCPRRVERDVEVNAVDQEGGRPVLLQPDGA